MVIVHNYAIFVETCLKYIGGVALEMVSGESFPCKQFRVSDVDRDDVAKGQQPQRSQPRHRVEFCKIYSSAIFLKSCTR